MFNTAAMNLLIFIAFSFLLSSCGGGGGDGSATGPVPTNTPTPTNTPIPPNNNGTALLSWNLPTQNTNGSDLTDLAGFKIFYGTSPGNYGTPITINDPTATSHLVENLSAATWYFAMVSFNLSGTESSFTTEVSKIIN